LEIWKAHPGPQTTALQTRGVYELLYGGARGGGKTDAGLAWLLIDTDNPLYRGLVIRKNSEDLSDWVDRARRMYPQATITGKPPVIRFPSGAEIRCGHLKDDQAYTKYQGHEYHRMLIEELTQIPEELSYLKLLSSCRSTVEGLEPRIFCTANPGGKGHAWVKTRFIDRADFGTPFKDSQSGRHRMFIPATVEDNPTIVENDPDYIRFLDSLPEPLRSAWRKGDWDVFAGQYFVEYHPNIHIISEDKAKTLGYGDPINKTYIGMDWGYANPFACVWIQVTHDNTVFCYRELYGTEKHPVEWAEQIVEKSQGEDIHMTLADPSMWIRNPMSWKSPSTSMYSDKSIAQSMIDAGVPVMTPANNNRVNGWRNMAQLMHFTEGTMPNFYIIEKTCPNLIRTLPVMVRDEKNPEDIDTTLEDHIADATRYALSHIDAPKKPREKKPILQKQIEKLMMPEQDENWNYNFG